ncbi:unnamed protein product, partial [marine sediment metagenome]
MMTDPIADMLTRMRNAILRKKETVDIPMSKEKQAIAETLKREGFVKDLRVVDVEPVNIMRVYLKYAPDGESVIRGLRRFSRPGWRVYRKKREIKPVMQGMGVTVLSTSRGVV